jgi:predicted nucleic acid-binding protein
MTVFYLDTSALFKRYQTEHGTELLVELFENQRASEQLATSHFTVLEVVSVTTSLRKTKSLSEPAYYKLLEKLAQDFDQKVVLLSLSDSTINDAMVLIKEHELKAPDAIQLASALIIRRNLPDQPFVFLCADVKLKNAASDNGLMVIDPDIDDSNLALQKFRNEHESAQEGKS